MLHDSLVLLFTMASMFKNKRSTLERADKFISPLYFTDVNLYGQIYPETKNLTSLTVFSTPDRIPFKEASKRTDYIPTSVGSLFGPTWTTCWFKVRTNQVLVLACEEAVRLSYKNIRFFERYLSGVSSIWPR